ncbi:M48 family metalloprotease [Streptomyces morookaense]|uniref:M48 family metalloprotease n=1 Tax=Streptomyces morookaense TaxID=1970 RepID=A0A7Y7E769_STRMO|nr:M48 family metallopeptidase [Streptomyces morookaense]NVK77912.1 M48 family metalloprotease [Streptomyces morookaense]GHF20831.1 Zn-dependent protease [Streptomyces morookaense]
MGTSLRALRALVLLAGFYLLALVVLGVFVGVDVAAWMRAPAVAAIKITAVTVVLGLPVLKGVFALGASKGGEEHGLPVTEGRQPELWRAVRSLAERSGTRAPDEIVLTGDVNAAVSEDTRMLGLLPGRRRLYLGVPLLTGLTEPQLHAVVAHELGHYGNADTRVAGITRRGRDAVQRTVEAFQEREQRAVEDERSRQERAAAKRLRKGKKPRKVNTGGAGFGYRMTAKPFQAYARFYLRATHSVGRQQELAADLLAVRVAGRDATASALRATAALDAAHDHYMERYATLGVPAGVLPPHGEVFGGLRHLLADPHRQADLAELRGELPPDELSPYDSHPPVAERVRLIEELPDDGMAAAPARPALELLRDPERVLVELEGAVLTPEALALERVEWPELTHRAVHTLVQKAAQPLRSAISEAGLAAGLAADDLNALLDAADAGRLWQVAGHLPKSPEAAQATGRAAREFLRPALEAGVTRLAELALVERAGARWELSWSAPARLVLPGAGDVDVADALAAAVRSAVADLPDTLPLRTLLTD